MSSYDFIKLNQLCSKITDGSHYSPKGNDSGIPMLSVKDMEDNRFSYVDCKYISNEDYLDLIKSDCKPLLNDVLIAKDGSYLKHVFVIRNEIEQAVLSSIGILRPNLKKIVPEYLKYYLQTKSVKETVAKKYVSGSALPRIILKNFGEIDVIYKDIKTQQKIASVLSSLDSKIELNNRINVELEAMAKTLYDYWFVQFDFPDANGKPYKTSGGKIVWNEELKREVPEGWEVKELTQEMDLQYGFPFSTELFNEDGIGFPVIRIRDILNSSISNYSTEVVGDKYRINKGDIIVGMDGNFHINYWNRDNCYLNQRSLRIRSKNGSISEIQARYSIEPIIKAREKNVSRTTVAHLSAKDVNDLKILKANCEFQIKANTFFKSILEKIVSTRIQNQKLTELRDWLLPMLMNGQVRVN
jgi:type I restriction enzyme S subunit